MTRLCEPPLPVTVELSPEGEPARLRAGGLQGPLKPAARWVVDADWWVAPGGSAGSGSSGPAGLRGASPLGPIAREYWKVLLGDELLLEVFHDLLEDIWYLERIYD